MTLFDGSEIRLSVRLRMLMIVLMPKQQAGLTEEEGKWADFSLVVQGEMINDSGTMTGGGGKPRSGRLRLGSGAPKPVDQRAAAAELDTAEKQEHASAEVPIPCHMCHGPNIVGTALS